MNKRFFAALIFAILSIFTVNSLFAQDSDWYMNKPIKQVEFEGLVNIKKTDLDGVMAQFIGTKFTDETPNELYDTLDALEYFSDINLKLQKLDDKNGSIKIILEVVEYPVVTKIAFKGNAQLKDAELKDQITIEEKSIYSKDKVLMNERAIRNYYIDKGFSEVSVTSESVQTEKGVEVTFLIKEGKRIIVKSIVFEGNKVVSDKNIKSKISLKEKGLFNDGAYTDISVSQDSKAILQYYQNHGYVDAKVLNVKQDAVFNEEKNRQELTITFEIQEGSQYTFGNLTFSGNNVFTTEKLNSLVKIKTGSIYNDTKFQESKAAIQNLYYENGYTSNQFYAQMDKDAEAKTISYVLYIQENPRSHIENIVIKGNTKTKEYVIRREIPIESGDIFSNSKITNGLRNLYNLQYFSSIVPSIQPGSEDGLIDVVFNVEEQSTITMDFGLTFSGVSDPDEFPVSLYIKFTNSNLFGEGKSLSTGATVSTDEQSVNVTFTQNWLMNKPISSSVAFSVSNSNEYCLANTVLEDGSIDDDHYYMEYQQIEFNTSYSLGRRWTPDFAILTLMGGISGSLINNIYNTDVYIPYDSSVSLYANNWEPKNSIWSSFSMDGRNISYDPSKGWFISEKLAWYGLLPQGTLGFLPDWGETEFYVRSDTKAEVYFTLANIPVSDEWSFKLVLMGSSGFSVQLPCFNSTIKSANQIYIDGMFNGRGWKLYHLDEGRGLAMWSNSVEIRWPFAPGVLALDFFGDAVCISDSASEFFTQMSEDNWYYSFGPSLRFCIQQFPIRLLLCNTFQVKDGQIVWEDEYGDASGNNWYNNWHFTLSFNITNR